MRSTPGTLRFVFLFAVDIYRALHFLVSLVLLLCLGGALRGGSRLGRGFNTH